MRAIGVRKGVVGKDEGITLATLPLNPLPVAMA